MNFNTLISRMATVFMKRGNRSRVEKTLSLVVSAFKFSHGVNYEKVIFEAVANLTPKISLRSRKKAGISYRVLAAVSDSQAFSFALRWLYQAASSRSEPRLETRIYKELVDAYNKRGGAIKKREGVHQTALINRGFVRFFR